MTDYTLRTSDAELARYRFMASQAQASEADLWAAAGIRPGARIADIGCGPAAALSVMAHTAGPTGWVSGVDGDEQALQRGRTVLDEAGVTNADLRLGRADDTGLEPAAFDVVVLRHVLAHNGGAEQRIVDHLATLARPGGAVYLVDSDITAFGMSPMPQDLADLTPRYADFHGARGNDPRVGLRLSHLASSAGLAVTHYRGWFEIAETPVGLRPPAWAARDAMVATGAATDADLARWGAALEALDHVQPRPLLFPPVFALVARRSA